MSKEEKEKKEEVILDHFSHHHPLALTEIRINDEFGWAGCWGCNKDIFSGEIVYTCRDGCGYVAFHEECAEMPREITLSLHPQHALIQIVHFDLKGAECSICGHKVWMMMYRCSESCEFHIHVACAQSMDIVHASSGERSRMQHPSHPQHELIKLWRPGRAGSLRCDACSTVHRGSFYVCIVCQYCIHESCATLPDKWRHHGHHHPLSLVYRLPLDDIKWDIKCRVCYKDFLPKYWVYRCQFCRYVAHINCVVNSSMDYDDDGDGDGDGDDDGHIIRFPIDDFGEELIRPFVMKCGLLNENEFDIGDIVKGEYKLHNPDHQLRLISSSSSHDQQKPEEEEEEEEDVYFGKKSKLVCDGCTAPIFIDSNNSNKYISCSDCNYFLHLACFRLPSQLLSHPLHKEEEEEEEEEHILRLGIRPKLDVVLCFICGYYTNGLFYKCTSRNCSFTMDIKCASLPDTIKHAAHPPHPLNMFFAGEESYLFRYCSACLVPIYRRNCYTCYICNIFLHSRCILYPKTVSNSTWDKHPLPLTFDPCVNHLGSFYCDVSEQELHPQSWTYHCQECDVSIHPDNLPTVSGNHRNIKLGQRYEVAAGVHNHPLAYQLLTGKLRCDVCGQRRDHGCPGFQCDASGSVSDKLCDFFMCLEPCGRSMLPLDSN